MANVTLDSVIPPTSDSTYVLRIFVYAVLIPGLIIFFLTSRPPLPKNAPKLARYNYPVVGHLRYFTSRWDWYSKEIARSATGNFSFYVGKALVIGVSGPVGKHVFFHNPNLSLEEGYKILFPQTPKMKVNGEIVNEAPGFASAFAKRVIHIFKREAMAKSRFLELHILISDAVNEMEALVNAPSDTTNPFISIYKAVYVLTMRMLGCEEIMNDPKLIQKTLDLYQTIDQSATPVTVLFPNFPSPAIIKRTIAGGRLWMIIKGIVDERTRTGRREDDALQYLLDLGDGMTEIIATIIGGLTAGLINTGINAANVLVYLAEDPHWLAKAKSEIDSVVHKYASEGTLKDRLSRIPFTAWESDFKIIEASIFESVRLQIQSGFRKNTSLEDVKIGDEVIPSGAYVTYHFSDTMRNDSYHPDAPKFDPGRYLGQNAKEGGGIPILGWGAGRHPCIGMKASKLEITIVVVAFIAKFDFSICDKRGKPAKAPLLIHVNNVNTAKPKDAVYLKYKVRG